MSKNFRISNIVVVTLLLGAVLYTVFNGLPIDLNHLIIQSGS